jgi:hypothetical protein
LIERKEKIPTPTVSSRFTESADPNGLIIFVERIRTERRVDSGFARTIGNYYVTYHGQKLPGLEGMTIEGPGPGDNSHGGQNRRLEARSYPLFTHAGSGERFRTIGFATSNEQSARPWPAIRIEETEARSGILIFPAAGYLMGLGTINLSKPLDGPNADIDFQDSRARVIGLIDAMKAQLGSYFPSRNNEKIPSAWIVITGEP